MPQVSQYSAINLAQALSNAYTTAESIQIKNHFNYLSCYLSSKEIDAKTIVIEENYISKDYLHDYSAYYSLCFEQYPKVCKRVHFFKRTFTEEELNSILLQKKESNQEFWDDYLGFVVVKPIPQKIVGFTLLKTYENGLDSDRVFFGTRDYDIHFFGNELNLSSLAFQEQDSIVAACATTAIWSMLHKASRNPNSVLKTPYQITREAGNLSFNGNRLFPNKGLNILQIANVVQLSGLEPEIKQADTILKIDENDERTWISVISNAYLKELLHAYSPIGTPIILIIGIPMGGPHAYHAITVSGFNANKILPVAPDIEMSLVSANINKFYAHDDQFGPFCRIEFDSSNNTILTPWPSSGTNPFVTNAVIPVNPKIRITYEDIKVLVLGLDRIFSLFFNNSISYDLVWDIQVQYSDQFKSSLKETPLEDAEKLAMLQKGMPKYIWTSTCYVGVIKVFDFVFDATDIDAAMIGLKFICYIDDAKPEIKLFLTDNRIHLESLFYSHSNSKYYDFLLANL